MNQTTQIDDFVEHLRSIHDALDEERVADALEVLMEIRESGLFSAELDDQVDVLRGDPGEEEFAEVKRWAQNLIGQIQNRGGDAIAGIEELSEAGDSFVSANELVPMSEAEDVGVELQEFPDDDFSGVGSDVHAAVEEASDARDAGGDDEEEQAGESGFSRETQPVTAVGHESLSDLSSASEAESDREMEGADAEFDRLPSVDFAVVESDVEDEESSEDEMEPVSGQQEAGGGEANRAETRENDQLDEEYFSGEDAEEEDYEDLFSASGDMASSFAVDEDESEQDIEFSVDEQPETSEPGPAAEEELEVTGARADELVDQRDDSLQFDEEDLKLTEEPADDPADGEESVEFDEEDLVSGDGGEETAQQQEPIEAAEAEQSAGSSRREDASDEADDGGSEPDVDISFEDSGEIDFSDEFDDDDIDEAEGFDFESSEPEEWSALDAFESSELEADSSDFDFDDDSGQEAQPAQESGEADYDFGFDGEEADSPEGTKPAAESDEDLSFEQEDPNQTRQPFSTEDEVEMYARKSVEHPSEAAEEGAGSGAAAGDEATSPGPPEADAQAASMPPFGDEEPTSQKSQPEESPAQDQQTGAAEPGEPVVEEPADEGGGFDLGFENPGEDDAAGVDLDPFDEESGDDSPSPSPTPTPAGEAGDLSGSPEAGGEISESARQTAEGESLEASSPGASREPNSMAAPGESASSVGPSGDGTSNARYQSGVPATSEDESSEVTETQEGLQGFHQQNTGSGSGEPLSEEEFFSLADELSQPEQAEQDEESSGEGREHEPTPHRGEPVVPTDSSASGSVGAGISAASMDSDAASSGGASSSSSSVRDSVSQPPGSFVHSQPGKSGLGEEDREASRDLATGAVRLIDEAESLVEKGNLDSAHDLVKSVLDGSPDSERAQALLERIEEERSGGGDEHDRETVESDQVPPLDGVPKREIALDEIAKQDFDHRFGFVLSLVDGQVTVDDVLELSSMSRDETMSVLSDMLAEDVISIDG